MTALFILAAVILAVTVTAFVVLSLPRFGRTPKGARLERIRRSPNWRKGRFRNLQPTSHVAGSGNRPAVMAKFIFGRRAKDVRPGNPVDVRNTDLRAIDRSDDCAVWFGHSSYLLFLHGQTILVDPVLVKGSPFGFINAPFKATTRYTPDDLPDIDLLLITHDHWDHLDCDTIARLRGRTGHIICPLGVGEHLEHWGIAPTDITELDWWESADRGGISVTCCPTRHFSGRGPRQCATLWGSFIIESGSRTVFAGGDSGYGIHLSMIARRFPHIDTAFIENGQYNEAWAQIHTLPHQLPATVTDLGAKTIVTVHHSRFALARHSWLEPQRNALRLRDIFPDRNIIIPAPGECFPLFPADRSAH